MADGWREVCTPEFQGCDECGGPVYKCDRCCAAAIGERNRLARFASMLAEGVVRRASSTGGGPWAYFDGGLTHEQISRLWEESASVET